MFQVSKLLYFNSLNGIGTDCSFVFSPKQVIHAHRCVLSSVSPVFEANFKATWKGDKPIEVNSTKYEVFKALMEAIYLGEIEKFPNLKFGVEFYKAAHFYQLDDILKLARDVIINFCKTKSPDAISELISTSLEFNDFCLNEYLRKYFIARANALVNTDDFFRYPPEIINSWYQIDELNVNEDMMFNVLDLYVQKRGKHMLSVIKPAIESIRLGALSKAQISETVLLSEKQKKEILKSTKLDEKSFPKSNRTYSTHRSKLF